jgi:hypothetical protein
LSKEEIDQKRLLVTPISTRKANAKSARALQAYLEEKGISTNFEDFQPAELAQHLSEYYFNARTVTGNLYKRSSLENFRHGLNRYLRSPPFNKTVDIIKDVEFREANDNFRAALAELKQEGKGDTTHYPHISEADLHKLYSSDELSLNTPRGLFNKVQFDVRYYFCRRGQENIRSMTKDTFKVTIDSDTGRKYVVKCKDELTKNHRGEDTESFSGFMPENHSDSCPVKSFEKYLMKLNPQCDALWQRPKDFLLASDSQWYYNSPVGEKTLRDFMKNISTKVGLSRIYTNHSCRTTGATVLSKSGFNPAQVMSVTGHKSVNSLAQYQRVSSEEKLTMGSALSSALEGRRPRPPPALSCAPPCREPMAMLQQTQQLTSVTAPTSTAQFLPNPSPTPGPSFTLPAPLAINNVHATSNTTTTSVIALPASVEAGFDLDFLLTELDMLDESELLGLNSQTPRHHGHAQQQPVVFSNCTFTGNVTFNTK